MTDTVTIELPRSQVELIAENFATQQQADWPESVRIDDRLGEACREALTNPPTEESGWRLAAERVLEFVGDCDHTDHNKRCQSHGLELADECCVAALRAALTNPQPETPGLREAAEEVDGESTKLLGDLVEAIDTYGDSRMQYWPETVKAVNHLRRTALSQNGEGDA